MTNTYDFGEELRVALARAEAAEAEVRHYRELLTFSNASVYLHSDGGRQRAEVSPVKVGELVDELKRLRRLCGEVWAWDRSKEREGGLVPGPLNVSLRLRLLEASVGALSNVEEDCSDD